VGRPRKGAGHSGSGAQGQAQGQAQAQAQALALERQASLGAAANVRLAELLQLQALLARLFDEAEPELEFGAFAALYGPSGSSWQQQALVQVGMPGPAAPAAVAPPWNLQRCSRSTEAAAQAQLQGCPAACWPARPAPQLPAAPLPFAP
jgi:hypothetical protein